MLFSRSERAERCGVSGIPSSLDIDFFSKPTKIFGFMVYDWKQSAQEQEVPRLDRLDIAAQRCWGGLEFDAKLLQPPLRIARLRSPPAYHPPRAHRRPPAAPP